jgi:type I restriction enzyme R subunit
VYFSELLKRAIEEAEALFQHPFKQYSLFKEFEEQVRARDIADAPSELADNKHASAYFGILRMVLGDEEVCGDEQKIYVDTSLEIEQVVINAVGENSVNPQNIESAIRKNLLPLLFKLAGLDKAKKITEEILSITRIGLSRGEL